MRARASLLAALAIAALALALVVRRGDGGAAPAPAARTGPAPPDAATACAGGAGRTRRVSVPVPGEPARSALVHLPGGHPARMALVLALHGAYGNGAFMEGYSGLSKLADREGFGVVYPDAAGPRWRIGAGDGADDVRFLDALLDRVLAGGCFDARRVAAVGVSNGAGMAARFACAGDDRLAGLVAVAGDYRTLPACAARRPLSVLEIHGTADAVVPYGTAQDPRGGVFGWVTAWVDRDACPAAPRAHVAEPAHPPDGVDAVPRRDDGRARAPRRRPPRLARRRPAGPGGGARRVGDRGDVDLPARPPPRAYPRPVARSRYTVPRGCPAAALTSRAWARAQRTTAGQPRRGHDGRPSSA